MITSQTNLSLINFRRRNKKEAIFFLVYGLPILLIASILFAKPISVYVVLIVVSLQLGYFLINPTPQRGVWVLLSYLFSIGGQRSAVYLAFFPTLPSWIPLFSYLIIPIIAVRFYVTRNKFQHPTAMRWVLIGLLFFTFLSTLLHRVHIFHWIGWALHFLRYPLLFLVLVNTNISRSTYQTWLNAFVYLAILQIPVTILQSISWGQVGSDLIVGTMIGAATGLMGLTLVVASCAMLSKALAEMNFGLGILAFMLFIPIYLGGSGFPLGIGILLILYIVILWGIGFKRAHKLRAKPIKLLFLPVLGLFSMIVIATVNVVPKIIYQGHGASQLTHWIEGSSSRHTSWEAFTDPYISAYGSRQMFIATTFEWFRQNPTELLLGTLGPRFGLSQQGAAFAALLGSGEYAPLAYINSAVGLPATAPQSVTQLPRVLLEIGLSGLVCFYLLFAYLWRMVNRLWQDSGADTWLQVQIMTFKAIWLIYVVFGVLYIDVWRLDMLSFAFWLWAATLYSEFMRTNNDQNEEIQP